MGARQQPPQVAAVLRPPRPATDVRHVHVLYEDVLDQGNVVGVCCGAWGLGVRARVRVRVRVSVRVRVRVRIRVRVSVRHMHVLYEDVLDQGNVVGVCCGAWGLGVRG